MSKSVWVGLALLLGTLGGEMAFGHVKTFPKKPQPKPILTVQYTDQDPVVLPPGGGPPPPPPTDQIDFFSGNLSFLTRNPGLCGQADRAIKVTRVADGALVGETTTVDGAWQVSAEDVAAGEYRATLTKQKIVLTIPPVPGVSEGHIHKKTCRGTSTNPITAGP